MKRVKALKQIAKFIKTGKTPSTKSTQYFDGEINWYGPPDLNEQKFLGSSKRTLTNLAIDEKKAVVFPSGTLLIGCIGDIGKLGVTTNSCSSNQQITGVFPGDETDVNYLYYWFRANKKILVNIANNAVVPILNNKTLESLQIPLPPLDQQKKIASILDAADAYRQKTKALISKYDELTQSLFLDMFGDPVKNEKGFLSKKLGEVCTVKGGKRVPKDEKLVSENTGFPYIKAGNIKSGKITLKDLEYLLPKTREKLKRYIVNKGDVCITVVGANIGDVGIVPENLHLANLTENANKILINNPNTLNNIYLANYLQMDFVQKNISAKTMAVGVPKLALFRIEQIELLLPPLTFQTQFAERVQAIEQQKAKAQESLEKADELFNSLLQKAFNGELVEP